MIIVGLTGGIGSGKTTVAKAFEKLGIPVYIADRAAKELMHNSHRIRQKLIALFGKQAYVEGGVNKAFIANIIFHNKTALEQINAIVHPEVAADFEAWVRKQKAPYVIKEVAILFENGSYTTCDYIITVKAPKALRIQRLIERDKTTESAILAIMKNQWEDEAREKLSDFVIDNASRKTCSDEVLKIHQQLIKKHRIL